MNAQRMTFSEQKTEILSVLDEAMKKYVKKTGKSDTKVKLTIAKLLSRADSKRSTFYNNGYQWKLDQQSGCTYIENKGKLVMHPGKWLRQRKKWEDVKDEVEN